MDSITLYYCQGSSDKVYQAAIVLKGSGFVVDYAYGRRGNTLQTGTKTSRPVSYQDALKILGQLVQEKIAKGYRPGEEGTPLLHTERQGSGILPQLLNAIEESEVTRLIHDPQYILQEKHDGRRLLVEKEGKITGINKLGMVTAFPEVIARECKMTEAKFLLDGEIIGDIYYAFDLLSLEVDLCPRPYQERYLRLVNLLASFNHPHIALVESAFNAKQKQSLFDLVKAKGREGVVFKRSDAPYTAGRPHSGGPQLKFKFCESASFIVGKVNGRRSVSLKVYDGELVVPVGNVTIPANRPIPNPGDILEVKYLYAYRGGSIFQPVYQGARDDIRAEECQMSQLKFKARQVAQAI